MSVTLAPREAERVLLGDDPRPVHFVGIAGAGMSGLAELLARRGVRVQGTDANPGGAAALRALGIAVSAHDPALVSGARAVVFSSAIPAAHPELQAARAAGLAPTIVRQPGSAMDIDHPVDLAAFLHLPQSHGTRTRAVLEAMGVPGRLAEAGL